VGTTQAGTAQRPRLHRAAGYAWVTLMVASALSALVHPGLPPAQYRRLHPHSPAGAGYPSLACSEPSGFWHRKNIAGHRKDHAAACISWPASAPVVFTLLPSRFLGQLVWGQWLGLI
jgi:uncharacterized membrane protein